MSGRLLGVGTDIDFHAAADRVSSMWVRDNEQAGDVLEEVLDYVYRLEDFRQFIPKEEQENYQTMIDAAMNLGDGVLDYVKHH
jgi:hypothetical protein